MKIAIVINSLKIGGGAEKVASTVGTELTKRGHDVDFLLFQDDSLKYPIEGDYDIIKTGLSSSNSLFAFVNLFLRAFKIAGTCKKLDKEVVLSFMEEANFSSVLSKVLFGNKSRLILSVRENPRFKKTKAKLLMKILHKKAYRVVSNSRATEKILNEEFGIKKTFTVYNPLDYEKIEEKKKEDIEEIEIFKNGEVLINVGRLTRQKGQWHLIRAFSEVAKFNAHAKLVFVGDGELKGDYEKMIENLGLKEKVFILGRKTNVFPYLAKSKAFVFTSLWEGMPNTVMEASAIGLPIVSTDCPTGPREIVTPKLPVSQDIQLPYKTDFGVLIPRLNENICFESLSEKPLDKSEKVLFQSMLDILSDQELTRKPVKEREEFQIDNVVEEWEMLMRGEI